MEPKVPRGKVASKDRFQSLENQSGEASIYGPSSGGINGSNMAERPSKEIIPHSSGNAITALNQGPGKRKRHGSGSNQRKVAMYRDGGSVCCRCIKSTEEKDRVLK
jgi:hypothetical protein